MKRYNQLPQTKIQNVEIPKAYFELLKERHPSMSDKALISMAFCKYIERYILKW